MPNALVQESDEQAHHIIMISKLLREESGPSIGSNHDS